MAMLLRMKFRTAGGQERSWRDRVAVADATEDVGNVVGPVKAAATALASATARTGVTLGLRGIGALSIALEIGDATHQTFRTKYLAATSPKLREKPSTF